MSLQRVMDAQCRSGPPAGVSCYSGAVRREGLCQSAGRANRAIRRGAHAFQEESKPGFPVARASYVVQQVVVVASVLLEIEAQVQERFAQHTGLTQQQGDQEAPHSAVAVERRRVASGRSVETASRRPTASVAASSSCSSGPSSARAGCGGSGAGTKARTSSPPVLVLSNLPISARRISQDRPIQVSSISPQDVKSLPRIFNSGVRGRTSRAPLRDRRAVTDYTSDRCAMAPVLSPIDSAGTPMWCSIVSSRLAIGVSSG